MENRTINLYANNQTLVIDKVIEIVSDTENYIYANVDLGENWQSFDSVRAIWSHGVDVSMVLNDGICKVPADVIADMGVVKVNLVGSNVENDVLVDRLTTEQIPAILVKQNVPIDGTDPQEVTPSQFEQFVEAVKDDADRAEQGASEAETSAQNASDSATSAHNSAQSAHDDKIAIEEAIAEVIQQIEDFEQVQVVVNTLPPSSQATSDFTDGVLTLGIPQGVKGDTGNGIQSIAKTGTSGLVDTYTITFTDGQTTTFNVTNGAKGDTGNGIQSIAKTSTVGLVDTYTITYTNGTTTTFTVTNGEKGDKGDTGEVSLSELEDATVVQTLSDNTPYNYRRTNNGNGAGHREYDEIVGASVAWNQLVDGDNVSKGTYTTYANGVFTVSYTSSDALSRKAIGTVNLGASGHKILIDYKVKANRQTAPTFNIYLLTAGSYIYTQFGVTSKAVIRTINDTKVQLYQNDVVSGTTYDIDFEYSIIDLTLFNSVIADYVYSLEQSTAGSGVTWLKTHFPKLFDNGYQPFDSGSIKSVSGLTAHEMVGVNQWDEEWELGQIDTTTGANTSSSTQIRSKNFVKVLPNTTYYFKTPNAAWALPYDSDKNLIAGAYMTSSHSANASQLNGVFTTPSDYRYIRFYLPNSYGATYKNDICINLSDTSINGQYFPHEKHTYPLDSSVTLRGQYKLDANNQLYADGDVYPSSGQIGRNYGYVVLDGSSDETWDNKTSLSNRWSYTNASIKNTSGGTGTIANAVASYLPTISQTDMAASSQQNAIAVFGWGNQFVVSIVGITTVADLRAYLAQHPLEVVYELATPTTESATPYESPQWCDSKGTEEYVGSELPVGHNTDYPMSLVDTMPTTNGTFEPRITVTNGVRTVTWVSV